MRDYQPLPISWFTLVPVVLGGLLAGTLFPLLELWSVVPALALGVLSEHAFAMYFSGLAIDWRNALLGGVAGALGGAIAVSIIVALDA